MQKNQSLRKKIHESFCHILKKKIKKHQIISFYNLIFPRIKEIKKKKFNYINTLRKRKTH